MRSMIFRKMLSLPLLALTATSIISAAPAKFSSMSERQVWNVEAETSKLLKQIKTLSGKLSTDASVLESFNRQPRMSWQGHAHQLTKTKEHINAIGERLGQLQAMKSMSAPWQQQAIDRITVVSSQLADRTTSAIVHLNENRTYLFSPAYADHLLAISDQSAELKDSVDAFFEFRDTAKKLDQTQQKLDGLQERLGIS